MDAQTVELDITGVAHGGVFVGRHEGRVVFVPDTLPGERVVVRITDDSKASFWRGEVVEVLTASDDRRSHVWPQADLSRPADDRPGGADFGHILLERQRALKGEVLADALQRFARLDLAPTVRPADGDDDSDGTRWRTRVSLHVDAEGRVGPFGARSHRVVETVELPLATAEIERVAARLHGAEGRLDLVQPADGRARIIPRPDAPERRRGAAEAARQRIVEIVGDREFGVDAGGFWQVHRAAAATLHRLVSAHLRDDAGDDDLDPEARHLDLYGGVGLFAATIGDLGGRATRVTTVESDPRATEHAGANLAEWVGMRAETGRVDRWLRQLIATAGTAERARLRAGVVVLDPPRAGAGRAVVDALVEVAPERIVYVACDPVALARDLGTFAASGYAVTRIDAVDLFPHSHHVEAVVSLARG